MSANCSVADIAIFTTPGVQEAFTKLTAMVHVDFGIEMLDACLRHMAELKAGRSSDPDLQCAVPLALALLHVTMGTPLHLTNDLYLQWIVEGTGDAAECSRCGYRQPLAYTECVLCGSKTGEPGCWAKARAARAGRN